MGPAVGFIRISDKIGYCYQVAESGSSIILYYHYIATSGNSGSTVTINEDDTSTTYTFSLFLIQM